MEEPSGAVAVEIMSMVVSIQSSGSAVSVSTSVVATEVVPGIEVVLVIDVTVVEEDVAVVEAEVGLTELTLGELTSQVYPLFAFECVMESFPYITSSPGSGKITS